MTSILGTTRYGGDFQEIRPGACKNKYFLNFQPKEDRYLHLEGFLVEILQKSSG